MPIAELGYRHWEGRRTGPIRRALSIANAEVRIAYASTRLLRRFIVFAWLPILYFSPIFLAIGAIADPRRALEDGNLILQFVQGILPRESIEALRAQPEISLPAIWSIGFYAFLSYTQSLLALIVVAIVGPPLIAKDLKSRAFLVYLSKPIAIWQYLFGKLSTIGFFVFAITLAPALLLYIVGVALSPDFGTLVATLPILLRIALASLVIAMPIGALVLFLSSRTKDRKIATFLWIAVWVVGEVSYQVLTAGQGFSGESAPTWVNFLSLRRLSTDAISGIFEVGANAALLVQTLADGNQRFTASLLEIVGSGRRRVVEDTGGQVVTQIDLSDSDALPALLFLGVLTVVSLALVYRRVRQQVTQ